jgi:dihydrofolate reductase
MRPKLTAIVAMTADRVIGRSGGLPWHLPEDLKFFKQTTLGHPLVMGRKTFESIGKPLPQRRNLVMTRNAEWSAPGVETICGPQALDAFQDLGERVFVIGGAEVYLAFLPLLDDLLISHVRGSHEGDVRFPEFESLFTCSERVADHEGFEVRRWFRD